MDSEHNTRVVVRDVLDDRLAIYSWRTSAYCLQRTSRPIFYRVNFLTRHITETA